MINHKCIVYDHIILDLYNSGKSIVYIVNHLNKLVIPLKVNDRFIRNRLVSNNIIIRNKTQTGSNHPSWKGCGEISGSVWREIQCTAKRDNKELNISLEYIWNLFLIQNRKCALSGIEIKFSLNYDNKTTASLDRKDSSKGYIIDNVQWVHKDINRMKSDFIENYFIEICHKISNYQRKNI